MPDASPCIILHGTLHELSCLNMVLTEEESGHDIATLTLGDQRQVRRWDGKYVRMIIEAVDGGERR